jgi:2-furoyl-CoA dehydrogenase large subunit
VAEVSLGVGPIKGKFSADVRLSDLVEHRSAHLGGALTGPLGEASGAGDVRLIAVPEGCRVEYDYSVNVTGKVAAVGGRMLDRAADIIIGKFFERLASHVADDAPAAAAGQGAAASAPAEGGWFKRIFGGRS